MSMNIRYPSITAATDRERIAQIKSYLIQLADQLNYALPTIAGSTGTQTIETQSSEMALYDLRTLIVQEMKDVQATFDQLADRLEADYIPKHGWTPGTLLVTNAAGDVVAGNVTFSLDEEGNLYYEVEE
jgi:hypothetical protein